MCTRISAISDVTQSIEQDNFKKFSLLIIITHFNTLQKLLLKIFLTRTKNYYFLLAFPD